MIRHKVLVHTVHFFVSWTTGVETQGGRYCHIWAIKVTGCMYYCEGYGFQAVCSRIGYRNQRVWV